MPGCRSYGLCFRGLRKVTQDERDRLIAAYLACDNWRVVYAVNTAIVGEHNGWRIYLYIDTNTGMARHEALGVAIELTGPVVEAWVERVREMFLRN